MQIVITAALMTLLAGCAGGHLAGGGVPPVGKSLTEVKADAAGCAAQAHAVSHRAAAMARGLALGLVPFVGVAADVSAQKGEQRAAYRECLEAMGYKITPAED